MAIDLDSITVDPTRLQSIGKETNTAIRDHARNVQVQGREAIETSSEMRQLKNKQDLADIAIDIQTAQTGSTLLKEQEDNLSALIQNKKALDVTLNQHIDQIGDLRNRLASEDLGFFERWGVKRELQKLDQQGFKVKQARDLTVREIAAQREHSAMEFKAVQDRSILAKQANDKLANTERAMTLETKLAKIDETLKLDGEVVKYLQSREKLDPSYADQQTKDGMEIFEFYHLLQTGSTEGFNIQKSRSAQMAYSALTPEEQRGLSLASGLFAKAKQAGISLTPDEFMQQAWMQGEVSSVKAMAKIMNDEQTIATIEFGESRVRSSLLRQKMDRALEEVRNSPEGKLNPELGIDSATERRIYQETEAELASMGAKNILASAKSGLEEDIGAVSSALGEQLLSVGGETPSAMLSPGSYGPSSAVGQFFDSDEVKQVLSAPDMSEGTPLISTVSKLADMMKGQKDDSGKPAFQEREIYAAVSDYLSNSASANYKYRGDARRNGAGEAVQTMEKMGITFSPQIPVKLPKTTRIKQSKNPDADVTYNLANPVDLQKVIELQKTIRQQREEFNSESQKRRMQALQPNNAAQFRGY